MPHLYVFSMSQLFYGICVYTKILTQSSIITFTNVRFQEWKSIQTWEMHYCQLLVLKMWRAHLICTHANPNIHLCVRKACVKCLQLGSVAIHVTRLPHLSSPLRVCKHPYSIQHNEYRNMLFCHIVWLSWTVTTLSTPNTKRLHTKHVST
jgi:hypothetical protein